MGLSPTTHNPVNRTSAISVNDAQVYSWLNFTDVPSPAHAVKFLWIMPNNTLYYNTTVAIPDPGTGKHYVAFWTASYIGVRGQPPAHVMGTWKVDIYFDGASLLVQHFTIGASGSPLTISEAALALGVNSTTHRPITITTAFYGTDDSVYSWLNFTRVPTPTHNITWAWFTPNGTKYLTSSYTVPDPGAGQVWLTIAAWANINLYGYQAAGLTGTWQVDVYVDGTLALNQVFTVSP